MILARTRALPAASETMMGADIRERARLYGERKTAQPVEALGGPDER